MAADTRRVRASSTLSSVTNFSGSSGSRRARWSVGVSELGVSRDSSAASEATRCASRRAISASAATGSVSRRTTSAADAFELRGRARDAGIGGRDTVAEALDLLARQREVGPGASDRDLVRPRVDDEQQVAFADRWLSRTRRSTM